MASRLETNFNRLLHRCETMAGDKANGSDWRLTRFVSTLEDYLSDMRKLSTKRPSEEMLIDYTKKLDAIKELIETERFIQESKRAPSVKKYLSSDNTAKLLAPGKELHLRARAGYQNFMKDELIGTKNSKGHGGEQAIVEQDLDGALRNHNEMQEKLAEEMIYLARNLRENASVAGKIVRDDTKVMTASSKIADSSHGKLLTESKRLETQIKKSFNCWIWIMLVLVCVTFVWMVIFMKMVPKS